MSSPGGSEVKNPTANERDVGSIPGQEDPLEKGNGNPLQYFCLGNHFHGQRRLRATVQEVAKSQTWLSHWECTHIYQVYLKYTVIYVKQHIALQLLFLHLIFHWRHPFIPTYMKPVWNWFINFTVFWFCMWNHKFLLEGYLGCCCC